MNTQLNKQLHAALTSSGLGYQKEDLVLGFSHGRSDSSKELTDTEAKELISYLNKQVPATKEQAAMAKMRRSMISVAHSMHWHLTGTQKVDMPRLNDWCIKFGMYKKKLNDHSTLELTQLLTQFKKVYNSYLHNI